MGKKVAHALDAEPAQRIGAGALDVTQALNGIGEGAGTLHPLRGYSYAGASGHGPMAPVYSMAKTTG